MSNIVWKREQLLLEKINLETPRAMQVLGEILTQEQADQLSDALVQMTPAEYIKELNIAKKALQSYGPDNEEMAQYLVRLDQEIAQWEAQL